MSLPRLERYLARVPGGFEAHPGVLARGVLVRTVLVGQARGELLAVLPAPLRPLVLDPPMDSEWVPEARFVALTCAIADHGQLSDEEACEWTRRCNRTLYAGPLYRLLMTVLSPEMLLRGTAARWGAGHRGTSLEVAARERGQVLLALRYPPRLYDAFFVRLYGEAIRVGLEVAGARQPDVVLEAVDDTVALVRARW